MRAGTRRKIVVSAVLGLVAAGLTYGFLPKPVPVDLAAVKRGPLSVSIEEEGKARVRDRFVVSAPVSGYLRRVRLDVGDLVRQGQVVAELEPLRSSALDPRTRAGAEAAVSAARSALRAAEERSRAADADAEYAKKQLERQKQLFASGYIARDTLDQAESAAAQAEANRRAAGAGVNLARAELDRAETALGHSAAEGVVDRNRVVAVRAAAAGRVLKLHRQSEGALGQGEPIIDIGNPDQLEVKVEVLSSDAVAIRPGMPVQFERWGGGGRLNGTVRVIEPAAFTKISSLGVEEQRVFVVADITSPPDEWKQLGDGYRVDAKFMIWEGKDVLQVPASALFRHADQWAVFVADGKRARLRKVEVGHRNGLLAEIVSGLTENEQVINHPEDRVRDGIRIKPR